VKNIVAKNVRINAKISVSVLLNVPPVNNEIIPGNFNKLNYSHENFNENIL